MNEEQLKQAAEKEYPMRIDADHFTYPGSAITLLQRNAFMYGWNRHRHQPGGMRCKDEAIKFVEWLTREGSPYAIMYGAEHRLCTDDADLTIEEVYEIYKTTPPKQ